LKAFNPGLKGSLFYLITFIGAGAYNPFVYVYFNELGLSGQQVGWLASLAPIMILLLAPPIASLADRTRRRVLVLQIALLGTGVITYLLHFPSNFGEIAILMLFMAIFSSSTMSVGDSLISRMAQRNNINYGGMRLWGSFGFAIAALVFGGIWQVTGFKPMFLVAALMFLPLIFIAANLEEGPIIPKMERKPVTHLLRDSGVAFLTLATFLSGISNSLFMTFGSIYARSVGAGDLLIGMLIAFGALAELPMMFYSNRIGSRIGKSSSVILAYFLMAAAFAGYIVVPNPNILPFFSILKGLGYGLWYPGTVRILIERTPPEWASTAQSLLGVAMFGLAPLVAGPLGGWIHDAISPGAVFGLAIITLLMAAFTLWLAIRIKKLN
jgi:PPP family 3-phenylpropionic acid transporter